MRFRSFVAGAALLAGCSSSSASPTDAGTPSDASTHADAGSPSDAGGDGETTTAFVGRVNDGTDGGTFVALVGTGDKSLLFFCGSGATLTTVTHWLRSSTGTVITGQPFTLSDGVATATGTASGATASGTVTVGDAAALPWSADLVPADAGVEGLWAGPVADAGTADLIVLDPNDSVGALKATSIDQILQVTPLKSPVSLNGTGIDVQVTVGGVTQTLTLQRATAN